MVDFFHVILLTSWARKNCLVAHLTVDTFYFESLHFAVLVIDVKDIDNPFTQRDVAKIVNIRSDYLNHIIHGRCTCPPSLALKLEEVTGIGREIWVWGTKTEKRTAWLKFQIKSQEHRGDCENE